MSTLAEIIEKKRQLLSKDSSFYKEMLYFFELHIPPELAVGFETVFYFPLVLPPNAYTLKEPFAVEATPTQNGGVFADENGIVQRYIHISGTTGFKPRALPRSSGLPLLAQKPDQKSYSRSLPPFIVSKLSGQRHFQYLQDAVFRTYGDLKRDPVYAPNTKLFFHIVKDDEHWRVLPQDLTLSRSASKPHLYDYSIDLIAIDKAEAKDFTFSEDKKFLDKMKDSFSRVKAFISAVEGAVADIIAIVGEIKAVIKNIENIIGRVDDLVEKCKDFVSGNFTYINSPFEATLLIAKDIESSLNIYRQLQDMSIDLLGVNQLPLKTINDLREIEAQIDMLLLHPILFTQSTQQAVQSTLHRTTLNALSDKKAESLLSGPPTTLNAVDDLGTSITGGEIRRAQADIQADTAVLRYTGAKEVAVSSGDTLPNLAARYLGDAKLWYYIAELNGLRHPYIREEGSANEPVNSLLRTVAVGDTILIPTYEKTPQDLDDLPVLGVGIDRPASLRVLGTDILLNLQTNGLYDIAIDSEHGSTDFLKASGVVNISQVVANRLNIRKGTYVLSRNTGLRRIVGLNMIDADFELLRYAVTEALLADSRFTDIKALDLVSGDTADISVIEARVQVRGFTDGLTIKTGVL